MPTILLSAVFACSGFLAGLGSARLAEWLQADEELRAPRPTSGSRGDPVSSPSAAGGRLVRDPIVQLGLAIIWGLAPTLLAGPWWRALAGAVLAVPLVQVAVTDLRSRYVYTVVAVAGLALGVGLGWLAHGTDGGLWWVGLLGAAGGLISFGALYAIGRLVYGGQTEPLARGDVTIAAMVGAIAGACTPQALILGVLASGLAALGVLVARRSRHAFLPYGPGLCLGGLLSLFGVAC